MRPFYTMLLALAIVVLCSDVATKVVTANGGGAAATVTPMDCKVLPTIPENVPQEVHGRLPGWHRPYLGRRRTAVAPLGDPMDCKVLPTIPGKCTPKKCMDDCQGGIGRTSVGASALPTDAGARTALCPLGVVGTEREQAVAAASFFFLNNDMLTTMFGAR
ncbi:hypothetical protein ZWY2020_054863 [Hordeum vulgare]|nr:hypothetical protein ZWY2020_054863 [Hordeum vulgare]